MSIYLYINIIHRIKFIIIKNKKVFLIEDLKTQMAGPAGFEPTMTESKSVALPLGYGPKFRYILTLLRFLVNK